ncbi:hypothetical protein B484DRAFT_459500 [Ochromonadaceae sp. CCMP2298]|nr:hypothetical protein B484DRAFT_459500 [Ochromonadaceae sp. CCMP2298]
MGRMELSLLCLALTAGALSASVNPAQTSVVAIKGHPQLQALPLSMMDSWSTWTLDGQEFYKVEQPSDGEGWIDPSSMDSLYLPADLPLPLCRPALGLVLANGVPRYVMPSVVLTLQTPAMRWRNRGLNSLPRSRSWIDLFGAYSPRPEQLKLSIFGRSSPDVRHLEDIDGITAWNSLIPTNPADFAGGFSLFGYGELSVDKALEGFKNTIMARMEALPALAEGYHFVDIVLDAPAMPVPRYRLKAFLTDFDDPKRLLAIDDPTALSLEPCAELDVVVAEVSAGGESEFLPEVYADLFEKGNIIYSSE